MMLLLPGNARNLMTHINPLPTSYGWLLSPRRTMTKTGLFKLPYAVDNECFTLGKDFDGPRFIRAIRRIADVHGTTACLFVVAPDVLGNAQATLDRFFHWQPIIAQIGFPVAMAAQDRLESLTIPWSYFDALFIGGTTQWKLGPAAANLTTQAKQRDKWVHMGRVNSVKRASRLTTPPDSVDGTAWAKHPSVYALQWQRWLDAGKPAFKEKLL